MTVVEPTYSSQLTPSLCIIAIEHGADYIFQADSDGQTLPGEFEVFFTLRRKLNAK